ncbi:MAG: hypothetical protein K2O08_03865 [Clostridia bacterium]|nr:hypothetical protein [Clostridia bacterium]
MNNYEKMKLAQKYDEDCEGMYDEEDLLASEKYESESEAFKRKYKEFYTDIKIDRHEDW